MILIEKYLNIFTPEDKEQYIDTVLDILEYAYAPLGGAKGLSREELMEPGVFFKLVRRGKKIVAAAVYTYRPAETSSATFFDPRRDERKIKYIGKADESPEAKAAVKAIMQEDIDRPERGFWAEISGLAMEHMYMSRGAVPIPNDVARDILLNFHGGKKIDKLDPDGYHYWRRIGDKVLRKMLIGNANITEQAPHISDRIKNADPWDISMAQEDD